MLSIVPVVNNKGVFTHKSSKSRGDRSEAVVEDNSNYPILVNRFCTIECKRMKHGLELLGYGIG